MQNSIQLTKTIITSSEDHEARNDHILSNSMEAVYLQEYIYNFACKAITGFNGGFWHFIDLSNGGAFYGLEEEETFLVKGLNRLNRELNGKEAGFYVTQMVLGGLMERFKDEALGKYAASLYFKNEPFLFQFNDGKPSHNLMELILPTIM